MPQKENNLFQSKQECTSYDKKTNTEWHIIEATDGLNVLFLHFLRWGVTTGNRQCGWYRSTDQEIQYKVGSEKYNPEHMWWLTGEPHHPVSMSLKPQDVCLVESL
jgi:hypothetical protein